MGQICSSNLTGIGDNCSVVNTFGVPQALFLQSPSDVFTASDLATEATVKGKIASKLWYPIHGIETIEDITAEDLEFTGVTQRRTLQSRGVMGIRVGVNFDLDSHKALYGYSGQNWRIIIADVNGNWRFTKSGTDEYRGFKASYFKVSSQKIPTGGDNPALTYIDIQFADNKEFDVNGMLMKDTSYLITELIGVSTVVMTQVGTVATNSGVFDIAYVLSSELDGGSSGTAFERAISGLVVGNFQIKLAVDSSIDTPATSISESSTVPGRYTIGFTTFVATDQIKVIPAADTPYESDYLTVS